MKILITTDLFFCETNGVVTSVKNLIYSLELLGHEVRVLTFSKDNRHYQEKNVYYIKSISGDWIYPNVRIPVSRANDFVQDILNWKPDIVHTQCEFMSYGYGQKIAKKAKIPLVHTYHTLYEQYIGYVIPFKRIGRWFIKQILTKSRLLHADAIIAPTEKVKNTLLDYGVKNRIEVIPSGIALEHHKQKISNELRASIRSQYGFSNTDTLLITLGRLASEKNVDELVTFFARVKKEDERFSNVKFLIIGDGPHKKNIQKLITALDMNSCIALAGMVAPEDSHQYYQTGDIFIGASTSETQGLTFIEAIANELPLLCRKDACLTDILIENQNGFFYENYEQFRDNLLKLIADKPFVLSAGMHSRELSSRFDRSLFGIAVAELYQSLVLKTN